MKGQNLLRTRIARRYLKLRSIGETLNFAYQFGSAHARKKKKFGLLDKLAIAWIMIAIILVILTAFEPLR